MDVTAMQRYELKYLLDDRQTGFLMERLKGRIEADRFGKTTISSLYYDTPTFQLIRASIENPPFKEKIRLRSYGPATDDSPVFLEIKRKASGLVYKRRVQTTTRLADRFFSGEGEICAPGQINREITAFRDFYGTLAPSCLIIYDRTAYYEPGEDLRLTIDENPRYRDYDLTLTESDNGIPLLEKGRTILEIKVQQAIPLWLASLLSEGKITRMSFSKYGEAFRRQFFRAKNY